MGNKQKDKRHTETYRKKRQRKRLKKAEARLNRKRKKMLRHQKLLSGELYAKYLTEQ